MVGWGWVAASLSGEEEDERVDGESGGTRGGLVDVVAHWSRPL
jgi:hypothetical protein